MTQTTIEFTWGLIVIGTFLLTMFSYLSLENYQGHYNDKGYRLCMKAVTSDKAYGNTINDCITKYADIKKAE